MALTPPEAGISSCHAMFVDPDGVCRPLPSKCALGTIPDIDVGCVPVGVPGCAPEFLDARGLCLPTAAQCAAGSFPVPTLGCVSIDGDLGCGMGTWGNVADDPANLYVDESYVNNDSDGSKARPFATLQAALTAASTGARLVLAAGNYVGGLTIQKAVEVRGVCASQVIVGAPAGAAHVLALQSPAPETIKLSDLTVDAPTVGIVARVGSSELSRVRVRAALTHGVLATGAGVLLKVDRSVVEDNVIFGLTFGGVGLSSQEDATLQVTHSAVLRADPIALSAGNATLEADDVFLADGIAGSAAYAVESKVTLRRIVAHGNRGGIQNRDGVLLLEDSVLGRTTGDQSDGYGRMNTLGNSFTTLKRVAIVDGDQVGLYAYHGSTQAEHLLFADLQHIPGRDLESPIAGAHVLYGSVHIQRSTFTRIQGYALELYGDSRASEVVVHQITPPDTVSPVAGAGMLLAKDSELDRAYVGEVGDYGIALDSYEFDLFPGSVKISRTLIENVTPREGTGNWGVGLAIGPVGSAVSVDSTRIENVAGAGIQVSDSQATIARTLIKGVKSGNFNRIQPGVTPSGAVGPIADGILFHGAAADSTASLTVEDVWIEQVGRSGVTLSTKDHKLTRVRALGGAFGMLLRDGATANVSMSDFSGNVTELEDPTSLIVP